MKVILTEDIKNIGRRGELKNVKDGYARNFLFPRGLAKLATESSVRALGTRIEKIETHTADLKAAVKKIANETLRSPLVLKVKVGEKGEVFGSVRSEDIKKELIRIYPNLKDERIEIKKDHLRDLGSQSIEIKILGADPPAGRQGIEGPVTIEIVPEAQK